MACLCTMELVPASYTASPLVAGHQECFGGFDVRRRCAWMQHRAVPRRMASLAAGWGWGTPHQAGDAQPPQQRLLVRGGGKTLVGRDPRIDKDQALALPGRSGVQERLHRLLTPDPKACATHQPHPHPTHHDDARGGGHDVGPHRATRTVTAALPGEGQAGSRTEPGDGRRVDGHQCALLTAQTHRLDRQVGHAPRARVITEGIECHVATLHGPLDAVPAPAQMHDKRQGGPGSAPLVMDQPPGHHHHQHHTNEKGSARRSQLHQTMHSRRSEGHWIGAQISG